MPIVLSTGYPTNLQGLIVSGEPYLESQILSQQCKYGLEEAGVCVRAVSHLGCQ